GDGKQDIVTGPGTGAGPEGKVFDGMSGAVAQDFVAFSPSFTGGVRVASGDVNHDGRADLIVGAGPGGVPEVKVFSGTNLAPLKDFLAYSANFSGGVFVAAGDINGDGFADIVTGADAGGAPQVQVFSGKDGSVLKSFFAYDAAFTGGVRVASADENGDGFADIITGAGAGGL